MVFQKFRLFAHMTTLQNVMLALTTVQKMPKEKAREVAIQQLKHVGLEDKMMLTRRGSREGSSSGLPLPGPWRCSQS